MPESCEDFIDLEIPELRDRGLYKTAYAPGSFRNTLFSRGERLPARRAAQAYRGAAAVRG